MARRSNQAMRYFLVPYTAYEEGSFVSTKAVIVRARTIADVEDAIDEDTKNGSFPPELETALGTDEFGGSSVERVGDGYYYVPGVPEMYEEDGEEVEGETPTFNVSYGRVESYPSREAAEEAALRDRVYEPLFYAVDARGGFHEVKERSRKGNRRGRRKNQGGRRPQPWANVGDASPFDYGGGVVYKDGDRYMLRIWPFVEEEIDEDDPKTETHVFDVEIQDDVFGYHDWADPKEMAESLGTTAKELRAAGRSSDPLERVRATEDIASYYGWENLDNYPRTSTLKELKKRYSKDVDKADAAEKKRALVGREMKRRGLTESPVRERNRGRSRRRRSS